MLEKILNFLFRLETVIVDGVYLKRWHVLELKGRGTYYLHNFVSGDSDRDPHDHPFPFKTIVLWGRYFDVEYDSNRKIARIEKMSIGRIRHRRATHLHRVLLSKKSSSCWTLVFRGKKEREWGFLTRQGWVHHKQYIDANRRSK